MLLAIRKEIELTTPFETEDETIETIYFGGGTPGILSVAEIESLLEALKTKFTISPTAEITLEANPDDIFQEKAAGWKKAGINRLSLGLQSFDDKELKWMNRAHDASKSLASLDIIRAAGFDNFSADLIYGSPLQSEETLINNIRILSQKNVPHISAYALTVEEGTLLKRNIEKKIERNIDEDVQAKRFDTLLSELSKAGYEQYEVSNFSQPGFRSRHNSNYWKGLPYYGFGPAAHSFNGKNIRKWNLAHNAKYIASLQKNIIPTEEEILTNNQMHNEYIMLGIRTIEGVNLELFRNKFGDGNLERLKKMTQRYKDENLVNTDKKNIFLTDKGRFLADGIAADLFL